MKRRLISSASGGGTTLSAHTASREVDGGFTARAILLTDPRFQNRAHRTTAIRSFILLIEK
jgi:hypothetical protein